MSVKTSFLKTEDAVQYLAPAFLKKYLV